MVDCTGLENRSAFTGTKGSNPFPSAMTKITLTNSVAKFGGTSVRMYYNKIYEFCTETKPRFVVVSAPGKGLHDKEKLTSMLFSDTASLNSNLILSYYKDIADEKILETLEKELRKRLKSKNKDDLYAFGEWASAYALSTKIGYEFIDSKNLIFIKKNNQIDYNKTYTQIRKVLSKKHQCIIPGFYGSGENGKIKILDRGGSDTTGALIACALRLDTYENITDFCLHVADPRVIKNAKKIETVTAEELRAIVSGGSSIISTHAVAECMKHKNTITIRNINKYKKEFTTINNNKSIDQAITAITGKTNLNAISISWIGLNEIPNVIFNIANIFREHSMPIEHIITGTDEVVIVFECGVFGKNPKLLKKLILEVFKEHDPTIEYELMDFLSVVGIGLKNNLGILSQITKEISKTKTSVKMVFQPTSELNITFGMETGTLNKVISRLYKHFF